VVELARADIKSSIIRRLPTQTLYNAWRDTMAIIQEWQSEQVPIPVQAALAPSASGKAVVLGVEYQRISSCCVSNRNYRE